MQKSAPESLEAPDMGNGYEDAVWSGRGTMIVVCKWLALNFGRHLAIDCQIMYRVSEVTALTVASDSRSALFGPYHYDFQNWKTLN